MNPDPYSNALHDLRGKRSPCPGVLGVVAVVGPGGIGAAPVQKYLTLEHCKPGNLFARHDIFGSALYW